LGIETNAHVSHAESHALAFLALSPYQQVSRTIIDGAHRVQSIPEEIQDHLL
jgi:hypothetical protein